MERIQSLQAVLDEDLRDLLSSIGELQSITNGERFCAACHTLITLENVQMIIPLEGGTFTFVCDRPECVEAKTSPPVEHGPTN